MTEEQRQALAERLGAIYARSQELDARLGGREIPLVSGRRDQALEHLELALSYCPKDCRAPGEHEHLVSAAAAVEHAAWAEAFLDLAERQLERGDVPRGELAKAKRARREALRACVGA